MKTKLCPICAKRPQGAPMMTVPGWCVLCTNSYFTAHTPTAPDTAEWAARRARRAARGKR